MLCRSTGRYYVLALPARRLLCYLFGTVYPFLRSIKAVATPNLDDDVHWLTYWMVFSFLTLLDYVKVT